MAVNRRLTTGTTALIASTGNELPLDWQHPDFLHNNPQFGNLNRIVATNEEIAAAVVEKDLDLLIHLEASGVEFPGL